MGNADLIGIGVFSLATGLSIRALRHYDDILILMTLNS